MNELLYFFAGVGVTSIFIICILLINNLLKEEDSK